MNKKHGLPSFVLKYILNYWFILHMVFIIFYLLYTFYKTNKGINPIFGTEENASEFNLPGFMLIFLGFVSITYAALVKNINKYTQYTIAFTAYLLISLGYIFTADKELNWEGSDVAWGNYDAANDFNKFGIRQGIKDWNDRASPGIFKSVSIEPHDSLLNLLSEFNLQWTVFNKWTNTDAIEKYGYWNNRPAMHPPMAPLIMSLWLRVFPFGKWSTEILMILLQFTSILFLLIFLGKEQSHDQKFTALMVLITVPVMIMYHDPSAEQLSMLLFLISVSLIYYPSEYNFWRFFFSGIIISLCFFTKFNIVFYIFLQVLTMLFRYKHLNIKLMAAYIAGIVLMMIVFICAGYYFWLTLYTGYVFSKLYAAENLVSLIQGLSKILYFGPSVLILVGLLFISLNKNLNSLIIIPVLLSLVLSMAYLWDQGTWNRYLVIYLPVLFASIIDSRFMFSLKYKDKLIIPITHFVFITLNLYF